MNDLTKFKIEIPHGYILIAQSPRLQGVAEIHLEAGKKLSTYRFLKKNVECLKALVRGKGIYLLLTQGNDKLIEYFGFKQDSTLARDGRKDLDYWYMEL